MAIHLLGASHIMAILDACSEGGWGPQLHKLDSGRPPAFADWDTRAGALPARLRVASLYVRHTVPFWGTQQVEMVAPGVLGIHPGLQALLRSIGDVAALHGEPDAVVVAPKGEEHLHLAATDHGVPYDVYLPWRPDLPLAAGCQVLPLPVLQAQVAQAVAPAQRLLAALRMFCPRQRMATVICPPPARSNELADWLPRNGFAVHAVTGVATALRLKLHLLYAQALTASAQALDIAVLSPPAETLNDDGTLDIACVRDVIHGNARYGDAVRRQLVQWLQPGAADADADADAVNAPALQAA